MKKYFFFILSFLLIMQNVIAQGSFKTVYGLKANYSISDLSDYYSKDSIGENLKIHES